MEEVINMPVEINDRPTDKVREQVIDQLIMNYSHGEISHQAFERRLDEAMATEDNEILIALTADLPLNIDNTYQQNKAKDLGARYIPGETDDVDTMVSIFSGHDRKGPWKLPKEIRSFSVFSGSDLDLSEAIFCQQTVHIKMFSLFAGDNIYVPENVNVVVKAFGIFGGVDNKTSTTMSHDAPTIVIEGLAIFSGIDIKVKKTLKEKFVEFADNLKKMFV